MDDDSSATAGTPASTCAASDRRLRAVTVGFVERPDGSILRRRRVARRAWAANLVADPAATVTVGSRTFAVIAELLDAGRPAAGRGDPRA